MTTTNGTSVKFSTLDEAIESLGEERALTTINQKIANDVYRKVYAKTYQSKGKVLKERIEALAKEAGMSFDEFLKGGGDDS